MPDHVDVASRSRREIEMKMVFWGAHTVLLLIVGTTASAQEVNLVSVGSFIYPAPTIVIGGTESYVVECDEKQDECADNLGNVWPFGGNLDGHRVTLCPQSFDPIASNCVHFMEIRITLSEPYISSNFVMQRYRAGVHEIFFDGNFVAKGRSVCGVGMQATNTYSLGMITPGKSHTLAVTASITSNPYCGGLYEEIPIYGFAVTGVPISNR